MDTDTVVNVPRRAPTSASAAASPARAATASSIHPLCPTIFHEAWWLDAASGGRYAEATVSEGGALVGRLPYVVHRRLGLTAIETPTLTHFLGPAIDAGRGSAATRLLKSVRITRQLLDALPAADAFRQQLHAGCDDALAFQERGYRVLTRFTAEVAPRPRDALWATLRDKTRNVIRRAQETLTVEALDDPAAFLAFYAANLRSRRLRSYYDLGHCRRIGEACVGRGQGRFLVARNAGHEIVAGIFYAWDSRVAYFLMSSRDQPSAGNGAIPLLIWTAIVDSADRGLTFDLDGFGNAGAITLLAGFGGRIAPRFEPQRESAVFAAARAVGRALRGTRAGIGARFSS